MKAKQKWAVWLTMLGLFVVLDASAFFDPTIGRWVSRDPIEDVSDLPVELSPLRSIRLEPYSTAMNNLVNNVDIFGLVEFEVNQCQGCNGAKNVASNTCEKNPSGVWVSGSTGNFSTTCSGGRGTICDTETHVFIRARSRCEPCRRVKIICKFSYDGTVSGDEKAMLLLRWEFLSSGFKHLEVKRNPGGTVSYQLQETHTAVHNFANNNWVTIATLKPRDGARDSTRLPSIQETGKIECDAECIHH